MHKAGDLEFLHLMGVEARSPDTLAQRRRLSRQFRFDGRMKAGVHVV